MRLGPHDSADSFGDPAIRLDMVIEAAQCTRISQKQGKIFMDGVKLSTDLDDPQAIPYFLWDEPMTVAQLKDRLQTASRAERTRLFAKILREARDPDVWRFTTPDEIRQSWAEIRIHLGRRRAFWEFLFKRWQIEGFIA
jgi:hypothetical protein